MLKTLALVMPKKDLRQPEFVDFYLPFSGRLNASNRWVQLAELMPWDEVERCYSESLAGTGMGAPAKTGRMAYGALVIKERLGITDEETAEQVCENPYLQYFLGLQEYRDGNVFDPSMMVHFRSRFTQEHHRLINEKLIQASTTKPKDKDKVGGNDSDPGPPKNSGKLLVDATCTPADIKYPTDLGLLNEGREKTESIIDSLHDMLVNDDPNWVQKPRTYRKNARKDYLAVAKQKKPGSKKVRKAIGQQLRYVRRNLGHIDRMLDQDELLLSSLSPYMYKCLLVIRTLYAQQVKMYKNRTHSIADRIVSISQPHVRPIVRGKTAKSTEFGAKISISHQAEGYVSLDTLSWDAYNEQSDLPAQIEGYHDRFGFYPKSVHADTIYRTRENRRYCIDRGIRLSGKPLGRPRKETPAHSAELKEQRLLQHQDQIDRIPVEGKFGNGKRGGTLQRIMAKLSHTSQSVIHVAILVLNLEKRLRVLLLHLIKSLAAPSIVHLQNPFLVSIWKSPRYS